MPANQENRGEIEIDENGDVTVTWEVWLPPEPKDNDER